jgi:hypothetical protein
MVEVRDTDLPLPVLLWLGVFARHGTLVAVRMSGMSFAKCPGSSKGGVCPESANLM